MVFVRSFFLLALSLWFPVTQAFGADGLILSRVGTASKPKAPQGPSLSAQQRALHGTPLSDGIVAHADSGDIRSVWLSQPTERYGHGVLGDGVEAAGITVQRADGQLTSFTLPEQSVFEDLTPRLADLDGDGRTEVIVVRAYQHKGAALCILGLRDGAVQILAETKAIGRPNRWLNPSILLDDPKSGGMQIGLVRTPHIGGQLQIWRYDNGRLTQIAAKNGFSNHTIGSRALGLSASLTKQQSRRILIPNARQSRLLLLDSSDLAILSSVPLPARPAGDFNVKLGPEGKQLVEFALSDGGLYRLSDPTGRWFD